MGSLDRWKHCVVNVEFGRSGGETIDRTVGTAIFVCYKKRYFLVTSAHNVIDRTVGSDKPIYNQIFGQMFRVPLLSELNDDIKRKIITKNIYFNEEGQPFYQQAPPGIPYQHEGEDIAAPKFIQLSESHDPTDSAVTISVENDLVVISLRGRLGELFGKLFMNQHLFVEELLYLGYQPVTIEEIGSEPTQEGADIFTIGYPSDISQVGKRQEITDKYGKYFSEDITLPCFTFGKVSMLSPHLPYFWGDLRVYSGNSGSPVIEDGKVVGIVSREAVIEYDNEFYKIPFAKTTKASFIPSMLEDQIKKDNAFLDPATLHIRFPNFFASPKEKAEIEDTTIKDKNPLT